MVQLCPALFKCPQTLGLNKPRRLFPTYEFPCEGKVYSAVQNLRLPLERALLQANNFRFLRSKSWKTQSHMFLTTVFASKCSLYHQFIIREVLRLDLALQRVKETTTFSGNGYFVVDKTTLTAMLSTTVTYLIVLFQTPNTEVTNASN